VGRDTGSSLEVLTGVEEGMRVVVNPNDRVREGVVVDPKEFHRPKVTTPSAGRR
jgi:multidrug efflux pump subunit AcrA (membrane-fusion protein)